MVEGNPQLALQTDAPSSPSFPRLNMIPLPAVSRDPLLVTYAPDATMLPRYRSSAQLRQIINYRKFKNHSKISASSENYL